MANSGGGVDDGLVVEVARDVVARAAPQELPLFPAISRAYLQDPRRPLSDKDELLGFGMESVATLLTPVVLVIVSEVLRQLAQDVGGRIADAGSTAVGKLLRRLLRRGPTMGPAKAVALTDEQLRRVRQTALEKAGELKLPEEQASFLADALVGRLAIG